MFTDYISRRNVKYLERIQRDYESICELRKKNGKTFKQILKIELGIFNLECPLRPDFKTIVVDSLEKGNIKEALTFLEQTAGTNEALRLTRLLVDLVRELENQPSITRG